MDACRHAYIHTCIHMHIHTYMHTCIHAYMHACIHAYMHTCIHAYMHTCIHAYMHTCIHAYIYTSIHAYIHTRNRHTIDIQHARACICIYSVYIHAYLYTHIHLHLHIQREIITAFSYAVDLVAYFTCLQIACVRWLAGVGSCHRGQVVFFEELFRGACEIKQGFRWEVWRTSRAEVLLFLPGRSCCRARCTVSAPTRCRDMT